MEQNLSNEKKLVRRGSFRMAYNNEGKLLIGCIVAAVLCVLMFIVGLVLFGVPEDFMGFMCTFFWLIPAVVCVLCIPVMIYGRNCSYNAGATELEVKTPRGSDYLYYSDVSEVIYKPSFLFGRPRGLLITVVTGVRDFTFQYIYDGEELRKPEHTPFYLLEVNSGLRKPEKDDPEFAAAVMSQFAVMKEKQDDRVSKKRPKKTWKNMFGD